MSRPRAAIILAAGQGTRMKSSLPKVLHPIGGKPMVDWAIDAAEASGCAPIILVVGPHAPAVAAHVHARLGEGASAIQLEPFGTAHAVRAAEQKLAGFEGDAIVAFADTPLIKPETLEKVFAARAAGADIALLGFEAADPTGYGRLIRDEDGAIARIIEEKDASEDERRITLCNSGVLAADRKLLFSLLAEVKNNNAKGEYYLTDVVGLAAQRGLRTEAVLGEEAEVLGVNSQAELAEAEAAFQWRARRAFMAAGVTMMDPASVYLSHDTQIAPDVRIEPHVVMLTGVSIARGALIRAFSHLEGVEIGENAAIGPFARLRPGARLGDRVKIGNFVEIKNASFGPGAQASHLAYIGDAEIGARANIGAGAITCNYDGYEKHKTIIGEEAFIGSDTALVAPVRIGARAYTGSGSVITHDVPDGALAVARGRQRILEGWAEKFRARKQGGGQ